MSKKSSDVAKSPDHKDGISTQDFTMGCIIILPPVIAKKKIQERNPIYILYFTELLVEKFLVSTEETPDPV